jgi:hypothetical protein
MARQLEERLEQALAANALLTQLVLQQQTELTRRRAAAVLSQHLRQRSNH